MSELNEINGIVFGGKKYTVGGAGEVPEGLIDPMDIEWVGDGGWSGGSLEAISPVGIPVKLPNIDLEGNYITTISSYDFGDMAKLLTGVILPSHLVEVPASLFRDGQLEFVEFGDQITSIGSFAFQNNQITSVVFPDSLTSIDSYSFQNNQITSVVFGDSLTSIGNRAFYGNQITSVFIPDSVTSISDSAFNGNPLEEVSIHVGTTLGYIPFPDSAVITVRIPEGYIFGEGLTVIGARAYGDMGLTSPITIADSVTSIGSYAFRNNQLTSVVIPDSVTSIDTYAFNGNPLEEVSIHIDTTFSSNSFPSSAVITYRIPEGYIYGEGLTSIGNRAFENRSLTGEIIIAEDVTSIGDWAFQNNQLTSVVFPDSLTDIGNTAFEGNQLTSIVIPDSVTSIGHYAFNKNPLEEVNIGPNTTYVSSSFPDSAVITVREN